MKIGDIVNVEGANLVWDESSNSFTGKVKGKKFVVPRNEIMFQDIRCDSYNFMREVKQILADGFTGVVQKVKDDKVVISRKEYQKQSYEKIQEGEVYQGKIVAVVPEAIFVTVDSLTVRVYVTECSRSKMYSLRNFFKVGQNTKVKILRKRQGHPYFIHGSIKEAYPRISEVANNYKVGMCIYVRVCERLNEDGYWLEVTPGIPGILNESEAILNHIKRGMILKVKIKEVDMLGIKCRLLRKNEGYD